MRIFDDARRVVVFFGHRTMNEHGQTIPEFGGTGFFIDHEGFSYLVTARHVAMGIHAPFVVGYNNLAGEMVLDDVDYADWHYHEDPSVDVAVIPAGLNQADWKVFSSSLFVVERPGRNPLFGPGDLVYIVGLYRLFPGKAKISPVVHTGHIGMLPSDPIPMKNRVTKETVEVKGYLIEAQTLEALSGSPVFFRYTNPTDIFTPFGRVMGYAENVYLLGLWAGAWDGISGPMLTEQLGKKERRVPVGMGIVIPAMQIVEVLNSEPLRQMREQAKAEEAAENAASMDHGGA
jgi:hypothetical protein